MTQEKLASCIAKFSDVSLCLTDIDTYVSMAKGIAMEDPMKAVSALQTIGMEKALALGFDDVIQESISMLGSAYSRGFISLQRLMSTLVEPIPKLLQSGSFSQGPSATSPYSELLGYLDEFRDGWARLWVGAFQETLRGR